ERRQYDPLFRRRESERDSPRRCGPALHHSRLHGRDHPGDPDELRARNDVQHRTERSVPSREGRVDSSPVPYGWSPVMKSRLLLPYPVVVLLLLIGSLFAFTASAAENVLTLDGYL